MKKPFLHFAGSIRFGASFINRMLLLCLLGIVMPQAIYSATSYSVQQRETVSGVITALPILSVDERHGY